MATIQTCRKKLREAFGLFLIRTRGKSATWIIRDTSGIVIDSDDNLTLLLQRFIENPTKPIVEDGVIDWWNWSLKYP
jgi:hypothetical protein